MFSDTQSNALELWAQKQKLKEMREELRSHISFVYGPSAWDEIVRIEAQQRKEQRELVYKKKEALDNLINALMIGAILLAGVGAIIVTMYLIGSKQGKF